jgi:hypothetical protein
VKGSAAAWDLPADLAWASELSDRDRMIGWRVRSWDSRDRPAELVHLSGARLLPLYDELGRILDLGLLSGEEALRRCWKLDLCFTAQERQGLAQALESGASVQEALSAVLQPLQARAADRLKDMPAEGGPAWRHLRPLDRGLIAWQEQGGRVVAWELLEGQAAWERMEQLKRPRRR